MIIIPRKEIPQPTYHITYTKNIAYFTLYLIWRIITYGPYKTLKSVFFSGSQVHLQNYGKERV